MYVFFWGGEQAVLLSDSQSLFPTKLSATVY